MDCQDCPWLSRFDDLLTGLSRYQNAELELHELEAQQRQLQEQIQSWQDAWEDREAGRDTQLEELFAAVSELGEKTDHFRETLEEAAGLWTVGPTPLPSEPAPQRGPSAPQRESSPEENSAPANPEPPQPPVPPQEDTSPSPTEPGEPPIPDRAARLQAVSCACECGEDGCAQRFEVAHYLLTHYRQRGWALLSRQCPHPFDRERAVIKDDSHAAFRAVRFTWKRKGVTP